jgi:gliding motility-associated-like protein
MDFTDTSTDNVGTVNTWDWDFDGLGQSALQNPQFTFTTAGTFTVGLTVTSNLNCSDDFQADVTVLPGPVADFSWDDVCLGSSTSFADASTVSGGGTVASWDWDFGDLGSATEQEPIHTYGTSGQFDVTLTVESASGCSNSVTQQVNVYDLPTASFTADDVCEGGVVVFTNTSTSATSYQWDLGDNTEVTDQIPDPHTYATHGTFNIELIVFSGLGCSDMVTGTVSVFPAPIANFTFDTVCFPSPTTFTDLSTVGAGGVISGWDWKFGDTNMDLVNQNPVHTYAQWGDYEVTLTVTTADGCADEVVIGPARVHPRPLAVFRNNIANCLGETTSFSDMSALENAPDDFIDSWDWNFGDGGSSTEAAPDHDYQADGIFPVTLTVVSNHGCESSVTHDVEIYPLPSVDFSVDTTAGCQPFGVQFLDGTIVPPPYNIASWEWDFGDGSGTSGSQFPTHTFNDPDLLPNAIGQFDVTLTVTSGNGCVSSLTRTNYISCHPKPTAYFQVSPPEADLTFANFTVTDASSPDVAAWNYTTGDWGSYSTSSFQHTYTDTGYFTVTQLVSTEFGCQDTIETVVRVNPEFFFYIPNTFTPNNDGENDTFFGTGVGVADYQMVIYDRWGAQVFESGDMDLHWDGTKDGRQVQIGVYTYMITVVDVKGEPHYYVGHVNLMR